MGWLQPFCPGASADDSGTNGVPRTTSATRMPNAGFGLGVDLIVPGKQSSVGAGAGPSLHAQGNYPIQNSIFGVGVFTGLHPLNRTGYLLDVGLTLGMSLPGDAVWIKILQFAGYTDTSAQPVASLGYGAGLSIGIVSSPESLRHLSPEVFFKFITGPKSGGPIMAFGLNVAYRWDL